MCNLKALKPADDYISLRRQFLALKHLAMCMQDELKLYREQRTAACWEEWKDAPEYQPLSSTQQG